jgi:hypothetical protein
MSVTDKLLDTGVGLTVNVMADAIVAVQELTVPVTF